LSYFRRNVPVCTATMHKGWHKRAPSIGFGSPVDNIYFKNTLAKNKMKNNLNGKYRFDRFIYYFFENYLHNVVQQFHRIDG